VRLATGPLRIHLRLPSAGCAHGNWKEFTFQKLLK
jgi:hypothetical protein